MSVFADMTRQFAVIAGIVFAVLSIPISIAWAAALCGWSQRRQSWVGSGLNGLKKLPKSFNILVPLPALLYAAGGITVIVLRCTSGVSVAVILGVCSLIAAVISFVVTGVMMTMMAIS